ncbi:MAG: GDP-mannose 4,6-dehydratase, partial [Rickettsiales bacterium]|nr:GDP-mannose 4,6-dehydratase [Rickettsiales bacterium]
MAILVTGAAGFIGFHVCRKLLSLDEEVIGIDNINDYYDVKLKESRLARLKRSGKFVFYRKDITDLESLKEIGIEQHNISRIVHLAAQPGVRYSIENPYAYIQANILGHLNVLEFAKSLPRIDHIVYASSSSVYGGNTKVPFSTEDIVKKPISLYAATKISDEAMSYCYSHMYNIPMTGL